MFLSKAVSHLSKTALKSSRLLAAPKIVHNTQLNGQNRRQISHIVIENLTDEEIERRFEQFFNRPDIDGWDLRQGMNDMMGVDLVPEPKTCIAVLHACRRVNEFALAVRFLEAVRNKCGTRVNEFYPFIIEEITPVLCELGISTPEELGYDKPELHLQSIDDIH